MNQQTVLNDKKSIAKQIRARAETSRTFAAMCKVFAERERTRRQITIHSLFITMTKAGYEFTRVEYMTELQFLADLGIGILELSRTGVLRALKSIDVTLQSIGLVGTGKKLVLEKSNVGALRKANISFKRSAAKTKTVHIPTETAPVDKVADKATLILTINGRRMVLDLVPKVSANELLNLIFKIAAVSGDKEGSL